MRVILILVVSALALPTFAGSSSPETVLPDSREGILESAARSGAADAAIGPAREVALDSTAKENNNECDEPNGPPCEGGG